MKGGQTRKLVLKKETIRALQDSQLIVVAGGVGPSYYCPPPPGTNRCTPLILTIPVEDCIAIG